MIRKSSQTVDLSLGYIFVVIGVTLKMGLENVMSVAHLLCIYCKPEFWDKNARAIYTLIAQIITHSINQ